jgi:hypothetical protein
MAVEVGAVEAGGTSFALFAQPAGAAAKARSKKANQENSWARMAPNTIERAAPT